MIDLAPFLPSWTLHLSTEFPYRLIHQTRGTTAGARGREGEHRVCWIIVRMIFFQLNYMSH